MKFSLKILTVKVTVTLHYFRSNGLNRLNKRKACALVIDTH